MSGPQIFARITKVDEKAKTVTGRAAQEFPDLSGEIFDYESSVPNFKAWAQETANASDGKSLGNVRAMHGAVAAGKLSGIEFNDTEKAVDITVKVVDQNEMEKVLEGVYTGFSIGGKYGRKWDDPDNKSLKRYTAVPHEISLVDKPCIPTALFFEVQKADGTVLQKAFKVTGPKEEEDAKQQSKTAEEGKEALEKREDKDGGNS
jgi:hypothetical protein